MNVTKIKITKNRVSVDYDKMVIVDEKELVNKYSIDSPEHPINAFKDAFQKMDFFLIELCELCGKLDEIPIMCDDVNITGLTFKYDEGELLGAIITGTKALAYSNSPLVLNTPYKSVCAINSTFDKMQHLTDPCIAALKNVVEHAKEYVDGKRLQVEIDLSDNVKVSVGISSENLGPTPEKETVQQGPRLSDSEDDGINTTKDVRDDSETELPRVPE